MKGSLKKIGTQRGRGGGGREGQKSWLLKWLTFFMTSYEGVLLSARKYFSSYLFFSIKNTVYHFWNENFFSSDREFHLWDNIKNLPPILNTYRSPQMFFLFYDNLLNISILQLSVRPTYMTRTPLHEAGPDTGHLQEAGGRSLVVMAMEMNGGVWLKYSTMKEHEVPFHLYLSL